MAIDVFQKISPKKHEEGDATYLMSESEVKSRIDSFLHDWIPGDHVRVESVDASSLLTWNRFDLAAKLLFLDTLANGNNINDDVYAEHIRMFTLGRFQEPGNADKNSLKKYKSDFAKLYIDMQKRGFDASLSLVPLGRDGSILNGAHRVACAIHLGLPINCVRLDVASDAYDYLFFQGRGASASFLDRCAQRFVEASSQSYVAVVWPAGGGKTEEIERIIPKIVYKKQIDITWNACHNLVTEIYRGESWLGERHNNYPGAKDKVLPCFSNRYPLNVYAFQAGSYDEVLAIKQKVRSQFVLGKHSIHINDTHLQSKDIARMLFNENGVNFLKFANPNKWTDTWVKLSAFKKFLEINEIEPRDIVLDSGIVLAVYGLRRCNDIDYISAFPHKSFESDQCINLHNEELVNHQLTASELVYDSRFHFNYDGLKFVSLPQVALMKRNRGEAKDITDRRMIEALIQSNRLNALIASVEQNLRFASARGFAFMLKMLKVLGIYEPVRFLYRWWRK